jgi:NDP-sugar pyrophosphorylase family protein
LVDGPVPAGTGGALLANYDSLPEIFFLMYGDSYLDIDYKAMYEYFLEKDFAYLMAACKTPLNEVAISNAEVANGKVVQFSKNQFSIRMEYEDFGLSILRREILTPFLSNKKCDLSTITEKLAFEGKVGAYIVNDKYYEVGSSQGISDFEKHMGAL